MKKNTLIKDYIENNFEEAKNNLDNRGYIGLGNLSVYSKTNFDYTYKFLELIKNLECKKILILGEGIGQTSSFIDDNIDDISITGIDNIELLKELNIKKSYNNNYKRITSDVFDFIESCNDYFDITLVDIYEDFTIKVPQKIIDFSEKIIKLSKYTYWNLIDRNQIKSIYDSKIEPIGGGNNYIL